MSQIANIDRIYNSLKSHHVDATRRSLEINGKHILVNGDSIDVLKSIPDNSIDLIFTDPPYNAKLDYGSTYNDSRTLKDYLALVEQWVAEYYRVLSPKGTLYLMNYPELNARILPILEDKQKLKFRRWITWHYPTNIGHSKTGFTRSQRSILYFTKTRNFVFNKDAVLQPYKNPTDGKVRDRILAGSKGRGAYDTLNPYDLAEMLKLERHDLSDEEVQYVNLLKNVSEDRLNLQHPCQLPIELIKRFISVSSNPGDTVLDPFAGTFTTSLTAAHLGRHSVGIEINHKYVTLGSKRFKTAQFSL